MKRILRKWLFLAPLLALVLFYPGMRALGQTAHSDTLTWTYTQGADLATGFYVWRATAAAGPFTQLNAAALAVTTLTYSDTAITGGTTYYYYVTAVDSKGNQSAPSNTIMLVAVGNPLSPSGLTGVAN